MDVGINVGSASKMMTWALFRQLTCITFPSEAAPQPILPSRSFAAIIASQ